MLDDVAPENLKPWSEGTADLRPGVGSSSLSPSRRVQDKWEAVFTMAQIMVKESGSRHVVPKSDEVNDRHPEAEDKLRRIVGHELFRDFQDVFERQDRHRDGEIELDKVLLGFSKMGGNTTEEELRKWAKETNKDGRTQKSFNFVDFVLAYANIFHPTRRGVLGGIGSGSMTLGGTGRSDRSHDDDKALGKSLRLSGDFKALGGFARAFGKKQLRDIERAFDVHTQRDVHGSTWLRAANILDVFHQLGRAITVTRLQEWMEDADVRPQDLLSLADFTSMFAFFFSPGIY